MLSTIQKLLRQKYKTTLSKQHKIFKMVKLGLILFEGFENYEADLARRLLLKLPLCSWQMPNNAKASKYYGSPNLIIYYRNQGRIIRVY